VPDAAALNVAVLPVVTVTLAGSAVIVGDAILRFRFDAIARVLAGVAVRCKGDSLTFSLAKCVAAEFTALVKTARKSLPRRESELTIE
jgi:hypothetical protein